MATECFVPGDRLVLIEGNGQITRTWNDLTRGQRHASSHARWMRPRHSSFRSEGRPSKLLNWSYRRLEVQLPFSGGPVGDSAR
jgi:hypothetical protein